MKSAKELIFYKENNDYSHETSIALDQARTARATQILQQPFFAHFTWGYVPARIPVYPVAWYGVGDFTVIMPHSLIDVSIIGGFGCAVPNGNDLKTCISDGTIFDYKGQFLKSCPDLMRTLEIALRNENNKNPDWNFSISNYKKRVFHIVLLMNPDIDTSFFEDKPEFVNYKFVRSNAELFKMLLELDNNVKEQGFKAFNEKEAIRIMNVMVEKSVNGKDINYSKKYAYRTYLEIENKLYTKQEV